MQEFLVGDIIDTIETSTLRKTSKFIGVYASFLEISRITEGYMVVTSWQFYYMYISLLQLLVMGQKRSLHYKLVTNF